MQLGKTAAQVSEFCLGTMYFGTRIDQEESSKLLDFFFENDGNFIDTSNNYAFWMEGASGGESETVIGKWFKDRGIRDQIILATKCGAMPARYAGDLDTIELEGLSYKIIIEAVEESLKRLQTDYIDVLYAHVDFMEYPIEERLKAFTMLREQGKIRFVGSSNTQAWRIAESQYYAAKNNYAAYSCVQQKYSFLRPRNNADFWVQKLLNEEMLSYASRHAELSILVYSTLLSGLYSKAGTELPKDYDTEDNRKRLAALERLAKIKNCSKNQLVLAWIRAHQAQIIPVISGSRTEQLSESIGSVNCTLSDEEFLYLKNSGL